MEDAQLQILIGTLNSVSGHLSNHADGTKPLTHAEADTLCDRLSVVVAVIRDLVGQGGPMPEKPPTEASTEATVSQDWAPGMSHLQALGVESWREVPRQAMIDALRNNSIGTNLSSQTKEDLRLMVAKALFTFARTSRPRYEALIDSLKTEIAFRHEAASHRLR